MHWNSDPCLITHSCQGFSLEHGISHPYARLPSRYVRERTPKDLRIRCNFWFLRPWNFRTLPCGVFVFLVPSRRLPLRLLVFLLVLHIQHVQHIIINTSSTQHYQHPSTQHHQINIIIAAHHHQHILNTTPSTQKHNTINTSSSTHHHQHNTPSHHRGTCSTWSTSASSRVAEAALAAPSLTSPEVRRRLITLGAASLSVAGAAPGASPARFAWQASHMEHFQDLKIPGDV